MQRQGISRRLTVDEGLKLWPVVIPGEDDI